MPHCALCSTVLEKKTRPHPVEESSLMHTKEYHLTFEITYSGFILGKFNFVIISAKITVRNSIMNYFCNFPCFLQISVLLVAAATDSKPGRAEDPPLPQKKTQLRMATNQIRLLRWATGQKDNALYLWPLSSQKSWKFQHFDG